MRSKFWGGIHPAGKKELSADIPPVPVPAPPQVAVPLLQHLGKPCTPLVFVGERVKAGQKIGDGDGMCAPVHAPISGTVTAIENRPHPNGMCCPAIVIRNDNQNVYECALTPHTETASLSSDTLIACIREAGIVGMGGATFPTDIKAGIGKVDTLIANACECEPYITADDVLICTDAERAIGGLLILRQILQPRRTVIAVEDNKIRAIAVLREKLRQIPEVELAVLPTRYPQGAEKQLIQVITGRQVPSGGLPRDVGCAVFNIATCASVERAVVEGEPVLRRIVTVTGPGVREPKNLLVPIGVTFGEAVEAAGGLMGNVWKVLSGGPMMGRAQADLSACITKGVNAIVVLTQEENRETESHTCIRCGKCVEVCPMGLQPLYLYRFSQNRDSAALRYYNVMDCIECGCCAYICPEKLPIVAAVRSGKQLIREGK